MRVSDKSVTLSVLQNSPGKMRVTVSLYRVTLKCDEGYEVPVLGPGC